MRFEVARQRRADFGILTWEHPISVEQDRDITAEPREHLREFHAYRSGTDDDEPPRKSIERHDRDVGDVPRFSGAWDRRRRRPRTGRENNLLGSKPASVADVDCVRVEKVRFGSDQLEVLCVLE